MKKYLIYIGICIASIVIIILCLTLDFNLNKAEIKREININQRDIVSWNEENQVNLVDELTKIRGINKDKAQKIESVLYSSDNPLKEVDLLPGVGPSTLSKIEQIWTTYSKNWNF